MKLIVDAGRYGFTRECGSITEALDKIRDAVQENAELIRVEIKQPDTGGGTCDSSVPK